jgi:hypothetical protein
LHAGASRREPSLKPRVARNELLWEADPASPYPAGVFAVLSPPTGAVRHRVASQVGVQLRLRCWAAQEQSAINDWRLELVSKMGFTRC